MAKLTTNISVRGVDLKDMLKTAHAQLADLTAMKEGMARIWSASFTMEADVTL